MKASTVSQATTMMAQTTNAMYVKFSKLCLAILTYFSPIDFVFVVIGGAIVFDTLAGRWAARFVARRDGKDVRLEVTSKKTREGFVLKAITYNIMILTLYAIDKNVLNSLVLYWFPNFPIDYVVTKIFGFIVVLIEFDSIDEKYYIVKGVRLKDQLRDKTRVVKDMAASFFKFVQSSKK